MVHYICKLYINFIFVYPIYYALVCIIRFCSHVVLWIILTFCYVGNAYGSTRHYRHCTLGSIAYSRLITVPFLLPSAILQGTRCALSKTELPQWSQTIQKSPAKLFYGKGNIRGVIYGVRTLNRLKWLVHALMLQWLRSWFALISRLSEMSILCLISLMMSSYPFEKIV